MGERDAAAMTERLLRPLRGMIQVLPHPLLLALRERLPRGLAERLNLLVRSPADRWARFLRGGFSVPARARLHSLAARGGTRDAARAAWILASWDFAQGAAAEALARLEHIPEGAGADERAKAVLHAECLLELGRVDEARARLAPLLARWPDDPDLVLAGANALRRAAAGSDADRRAWLDPVNRLFHAAGLLPLGAGPVAGPPSPLGITTARPDGDPQAGRALVSVLMPVWRAGKELAHALDGLRRQSWTNLEIIVIDDGSDDGTADRVRVLAQGDPRISVLAQAENQGAYAARNLGLTRARGDLVTVHDSDDWSHPQKLALQARHLLAHPQLPANMTAMVRLDDDGRFLLPLRPEAGLVRVNYSSLMIRRPVLERLGGWDRVRISADAELADRLRHAFGKGAVPLLHPRIPMTLARQKRQSLTAASRTGLQTYYHGVRHEYRMAAAHWRDGLGGRFPTCPPPQAPRHFPAPGFILPRPQEPDLDLLFVLDASRPVPGLPDLDRMLRRLAEAGLATGLFHWQLLDRHGLSEPRGPDPALRTLAGEGRLTLVCPAEVVAARTVLVPDPRPLRVPIDAPPVVSCARFLVADDGRGGKLHAGLLTACPARLVSRREILATIEEAFATRPPGIG